MSIRELRTELRATLNEEIAKQTLENDELVVKGFKLQQIQQEREKDNAKRV